VTAPGLDHVSITVADLETSIAFYRDLLGLPLLDRGHADEPELSTLLSLDDVELDWAELSLGPTILELVQYRTAAGDPLTPHPNRPGATHIGLAVDDITPLATRLRETGAVISNDVVTLTEDSDWHGARVLYATDPDGVTIELVQRADHIVVVPEETQDATSERQIAPR
jgi:catechol 2,3-dioxygenase-like lactoylglutathione lyase family enzyme